MENDPTYTVRFYADWQILSLDENFDPTEHMNWAFSDDEQDMVQEFQLITVAGNGGLFYAFFTGTMQMDGLAASLNPRSHAKDVLDEIVHDTDVDVRWVQRELAG